jgi:hypothetical protein
MSPRLGHLKFPAEVGASTQATAYRPYWRHRQAFLQTTPEIGALVAPKTPTFSMTAGSTFGVPNIICFG